MNTVYLIDYMYEGPLTVAFSTLEKAQAFIANNEHIADMLSVISITIDEV